jgi:hypothetical protein
VLVLSYVSRGLAKEYLLSKEFYQMFMKITKHVKMEGLGPYWSDVIPYKKKK